MIYIAPKSQKRMRTHWGLALAMGRDRVMGIIAIFDVILTISYHIICGELTASPV